VLNGDLENHETLSEEYEVGSLPVLINEIKSPYPPSARAKGIQGAVVLEFVVGSDGKVRSPSIIQSPAPELSEAALMAIRKFRFKPAHLGDKDVAIRIRYTYRFVLQ
jgi:protein TonB